MATQAVPPVADVISAAAMVVVDPPLAGGATAPADQSRHVVSSRRWWRPSAWLSRLRPAPGPGSLSRRMIGIATAWILLLLAGGGYALDRELTRQYTANFDTGLEQLLLSMMTVAEIGPDGRVVMAGQLGEPALLTPYSGVYWQVDGGNTEPSVSRSLWDRTLKLSQNQVGDETVYSDNEQFDLETLRVAERDVQLEGSPVNWRFRAASSRAPLDLQLGQLRRTIIISFVVLGLGLIVLAALQTVYGLWPLRRLQRNLAAMREGQQARLDGAMPVEVQPMVEELNALLAHNEQQAEDARLHAGNLAHALKTPLTVIINAATAQSPDLAELVVRESATMQRQVDHHLARARALGRRGNAQARASVRPSISGVERAVSRLYPDVRFDADGDLDAVVRMERQDLDEILGNVMENAAKYGGGSVFVTVGYDAATAQTAIMVEDDGAGIGEDDRQRLFDRGVRLDSGKPGTGLGLAIVRDVLTLYGGTVTLADSDDLGGLMVTLTIPSD
jgi:signal transduction histidine kinase